MAKITIQDLSPEVLEQIFSYLDSNSVVCAAKVCLQWQLLCQTITKNLCCNNMPSDVFIEIWEETGLGIPIDFIKVWGAWMESQIQCEPIACSTSSLSLQKLSSNFSGAWTPHSHGHQLIRSTCAVRGNFLYIGDADGTLAFYDVFNPEFTKENNISDGAVREIEIWHSENILAVSGDSKVHFFDLDTLAEVRMNSEVKSGANKHLSTFGNIISFSEKDAEITGCETKCSIDKNSIELVTVFNVTLAYAAIQWKLWLDKITVLEVSGEISIYKRKGKETELEYKTESNMMIMYKNPCFLFRDIIFCSTSASVGLIVRTSYWLLGWALERDGGRLTRALDQDKLNPADDVWCLALRRNILVCGTEGGCLVVFTGDKTEPSVANDLELYNLDMRIKRGHSNIELEFDKYRKPAFKKMVSKKPILSVDVGFCGDKILLYYRTDIQNISCIILKNDVSFNK
eukprot:TRINITY_DN17975_c0_g1_i1.p1 TRINITY_DN17975_c0_g1~~TRINITY_DN17975_c0_g1_i1.p1  ORF type:complete len:457 (-),score=67.18 TRINITY_DN17975_c0_g1_i1:15-1385(-)